MRRPALLLLVTVCILTLFEISLIQHHMQDAATVFRDEIYLPEATTILDARDEQKDAVFFTETSGKGTVRARFVCAVESAAIAYPLADIYLLVVQSEDKLYYNEENKALFTVLAAHRNVRVLHVDLDVLYKNSPLEEFHKSGKIQKSLYLSTHISDILRMFVVCKYGGRYMDLDIIAVKNISEKYYVITELDNPDSYLANGFFAFEKNFEMCPWILDQISEGFNATDWYANGPSVWTNAMYKYTGVATVGNMTNSNLNPFKKLHYSSLFPISWFELDFYFDELKSELAMQKISNVEDLIGLHVGNNAVKHWGIMVGSKQAYGLLAQNFCPLSYWNSAFNIF